MSNLSNHTSMLLKGCMFHVRVDHLSPGGKFQDLSQIISVSKEERKLIQHLEGLSVEKK